MSRVSTTWKPGQSGNPRGGKPGQLPKATRELQEAMLRLQRKHKRPHPVLCLYEIGIDPLNPLDIRVKALSEAAEYVAFKVRCAEIPAQAFEEGVDQTAQDNYRIGIVPLQPAAEERKGA